MIVEKVMSMEIGRLAQRNYYGVTPTDTIDFIPYELVPKDTKVTYTSFVADYRPLKLDPNRIQYVVGGNTLDYEGDARSPTTNLAEAKIMFNTVIYDTDKGAKFMTCDLEDHFVASPTKEA